MSDLKWQALKSLKWSFLGEIATRAIQPIPVLILARLLSPEDFGLVGVAMTLIGLSQIFQDFGLGKAIIQRETDIEETSNIVFWSNLLLGALVSLVIILIAPTIAVLFNESRLTNVLRVLSFQIIFTSLTTVHQALFQRNFLFKHLSLIRLSSGIVPGVVSIPMAYLGYGVWALVAGTMVGSIFQTFIFWYLTFWKPRLSYDLKLAREIYGFSIWVFLEALLSWLILWGDSIALGYFLGVKELGIYRLGVTLTMYIFGLVFNPILPVAYSTFSRLQSQPLNLKHYLLRLTRLIAFVSLPMGAIVVVLASSLTTIVFGEKWTGLETVIAILAVKESIGWLVGISPEIYRAMGRPDVNTKMLIATAAYYIPAYILFASNGLLAFTFARLGLALVGMCLHVLVTNRLVGLSYTYLLECTKKSLVASLLMGSFLFFMSTQINLQNTYLSVFLLFLTALMGVVIYILTIKILDKQLLGEVKLLIIHGRGGH